VLRRESEEVIPIYPVLTSRESESRQVALFNPAQDGNFTDTAMPGDDTGGKIFRVGFVNVSSQVKPPLGRIYGVKRIGCVICFFSLLIIYTFFT
jgi:hypothetical protein